MTETTEPTVAAAQPETKTPETATTPTAEGETPAVVDKENGDTAAEPKVEEDQAPVKEMRAVVLTGFGGYKGVKIQKKPEPTCAPGEVLIRVKAW